MFNKLKSINFIRLLKLNRFEKPVIFVLVISIFIVGNILINPLALRLDLSQGQANTLSNSTRKILTNLDDLITIKFYISSDLPSQLIPVKTEVTDLINEYKKLGGNKVSIKVLDPKKDDKALQEVKETGIPELQFSQLEKDKFAVSSAYFGIAVLFGNNKEVIAQATEINGLEYNLTSAIYKLTRTESPTIGLIGESQAVTEISTQPQSTLSIFKQFFGKEFTLNNIGIPKITSSQLSKNINAVLIIDNKTRKYEDDEIQVVKEYLENGGKAVIFADGVWIDENLETSNTNSNLSSLTGDYGITINPNLVLSTSAELVNFGDQTMQYLIPYPFWLKTNVFDKSTSLFSNVGQLTFPWASSLSISEKSGIEQKAIIKSTVKSWEQKSNFILNPQNITLPQQNELKEFTLVATAKKGNSDIAVIPSSRFIEDRYLNQSSNNLDFMLNLLSDMAAQGALSGIRSRAVNFYPLPEFTDNQKDIYRVSVIFLLPLIFVCFGAIRLFRRK